MKSHHSRSWIRLTLTFLAAIALSYGLTYLVQTLLSKTKLPIHDLSWLAYLTVFIISIIANLTVIVPVPLAISIMIAAATQWNPLLIALVGSLGGSIGELSGYYVGYLGKKIAIFEDTTLYARVARWIKRYGIWAIFVFAAQPLIPFDIGGFIAGTARMPLLKFWPALFLGKSLKYIVFTFAGVGLIGSLPAWFH